MCSTSSTVRGRIPRTPPHALRTAIMTSVSRSSQDVERTAAVAGLYDPAYEHDGCGIGFIAHIHGVRSHDVVRDALQLLDNLSHRSAVGCDPCTGDGAGILLQVPHAFLWNACRMLGF